jgi:hypothetical protein
MALMQHVAVTKWRDTGSSNHPEKKKCKMTNMHMKNVQDIILTKQTQNTCALVNTAMNLLVP